MPLNKEPKLNLNFQRLQPSGFGLAWFYGISTTECYLMTNPVYTYKHDLPLNNIKYIYMICKHIS